MVMHRNSSNTPQAHDAVEARAGVWFDEVITFGVFHMRVCTRWPPLELACTSGRVPCGQWSQREMVGILLWRAALQDKEPCASSPHCVRCPQRTE